MEQQQISPKKQKALDKVKRANAELAKVVREEKSKMEVYVQSKGWTTFDEMQVDRKAVLAEYEKLDKSRGDMSTRMDYLEKLLGFHEKYEPYQKVNAEYWKLKKAEEKNGKPLGFFRKSQAEEYKKKHRRNSILRIIGENRRIPDSSSNPPASSPVQIKKSNPSKQNPRIYPNKIFESVQTVVEIMWI